MTTIVGTHEFLVTDSMVNDGDQKWEQEKVERIGDALYATAGDTSDGERFYAWIRRGKRGKKPSLDDGFYALVLNKDGLFFYDKNLAPSRLPGPHAIGSGAKAARGAMKAGADPVRAVEIACEVDSESSPPIRVFYLNEKAAQ